MTKKNTFKIILFISVIIIIVLKTNSAFTSNKDSENFSAEISLLKKITGSTDIIIKPTVNNNIFKYITSDRKNTGHFISTKNLKNKRTGYGGNLDFIFILDNNNTIAKMELFPNKETPAFMNLLSKKGFFNTWNNIALDKAHEIKVDTITGATVSTSAIISNSKILFNKINTNKLIKTEEKLSNSEYLYIGIFILLIFLSIYEFKNRSNFHRKFLMFFSIIFTGFTANKLLSLSFLFNRFSQNYSLWYISTDNIVNILLILLFIFALYTAIFLKQNFYCYYFCPYGFLQELFSKNSFRKRQISKKTVTIFKTIRIILLISALLLIFLELSQYTDLFEPFAAFSFAAAPISAKIIFVLFIIISIFIPRLWCRFLCPTGYLFEFLRSGSRK